MRHISQIKNLPISELTDEEIAKAAMHRLKARMCGIVYMDQEGQTYFLFRYKDSRGNVFHKQMIKAWESLFGKLRHINKFIP